MDVLKIPINPLYRKTNGTTVIRVDSNTLPIPFEVKYEALIYLPPNEFGGNHKHKRQEAFIGSADLELVWINSKGEKERVKMQSGNDFFIFVIPEYVPHAVLNTSDSATGILLEFADTPEMVQEKVEVI